MLCVFVVFSLTGACLGDIGQWDVFGTKTTYDWAHHTPEPAVDGEYEKTDGNDTCKAAQVYMVLRHGSRYPSDGTMEVIDKLLMALEEVEDGPFYQSVQNYPSNYTMDLAGMLAPLGEQEQYDIGRRTLIKLRTLFENNGQYLKFVSSTRPRNTASSIKFYEGLNSTVIGIGDFDHVVNATLTHYYSGCDNYDILVEENETHMMEFLAYEKTDEFVFIKENLTSSLGLNLSLTAGKTISIMRSMFLQ